MHSTWSKAKVQSDLKNKQSTQLVFFAHLIKSRQLLVSEVHIITEVGDQGSTRTKKIVLYRDTWNFTVLYGQ
jgi:hypothetical protein